MPMQDTLSVVQDTVVSSAAPVAADTVEVSVEEATGEAIDQVQGMIDTLFASLPRIAVALVVLAVVWLIAKGVRSVVHRVTPGPADSSIGIVLGRLAYASLLVLGVFLGLVIIIPSLKFSAIFAGLGLGGVAIGFAFQDIFQNLLAGILILIREPFRVGDEITSGSFTGTVEAIETRATFIRTYDGRRIIVPNSQIYSEPVQVITAYHMVRSQYDVGIGYGDDIETAKQIALDTVRGIEGIMDDPAPDVLTWDLAGSSVNLRVRWWTDPVRKNVVKLRDQVLMRVSQALLSQGIDLPFPTQQILFHDQTETTDGDRTQQREGWPVPASGTAPEPARISLAVREAASAASSAAASSGQPSSPAQPPPEADAPEADAPEEGEGA